MAYQGGCLCGGIRFQIQGKITNIVYCHCSQCRKVQGSAFATNGVVDLNEFVISQGKELMSGFESSPGKTKYFCRQCAAPIYSDNVELPGVVRVRLGTIESEITERPEAHIFVGSKANWHTICDDLPQFEEFPA